MITLFESQIILAEYECCTNWGDCKSNQIKSNQMLGFEPITNGDRTATGLSTLIVVTCVAAAMYIHTTFIYTR